MTLLNPKSLRADDSPRFQCYQTMGETTERTYGRYVRTRGGTGNTKNLPPYSPQAHCCVHDATIVRMDETDRNGFGIFFCRGTQPNKVTTTIPTILLRSDGKTHSSPLQNCNTNPKVRKQKLNHVCNLSNLVLILKLKQSVKNDN